MRDQSTKTERQVKELVIAKEEAKKRIQVWEEKESVITARLESTQAEQACITSQAAEEEETAAYRQREIELRDKILEHDKELEGVQESLKAEMDTIKSLEGYTNEVVTKSEDKIKRIVTTHTLQQEESLGRVQAMDITNIKQVMADIQKKKGSARLTIKSIA